MAASATTMQLKPAGPSALKPQVSRSESTLSTLSLDRKTEQDAIVVDEGYCNIEDPSFGDAADRLAYLELEDLGTPTKGTSSKSLRDSVAASLPGNSSKSLRAASSRSLNSTAGTPTQSAPTADRAASARSIDNLPPGSPFSQPEFQSSDYPAMSTEEAEAKLKNMQHIPNHLLSGLKSLSADELTLYMQLTEELKKEGVGQQSSTNPTLPTSRDTSSLEPISSQSSIEEEERLDSAVRKLKQLLPQSAIDTLQSHASYGLLDVLHSQPLTPPPTPTSASRPEN